MFRRLLIVATAALLAMALPAAACPNWRGAPHFGQIQLRAGFLPDPYVRNVTAGGTHDLRRCFSGNHAGFVTVRPDFDLYWNGRSSRLTIAVESRADTILLVNDPQGRFFYNDDYRGLNPALIFNNPLPGLYNIWVGSYDGSRRNPARLIITEYQY